MLYFNEMKKTMFFILGLMLLEQEFLIQPVQKITFRRMKGYFFAFHVTDVNNLPSIFETGLLPDKRYSPSGTDPGVSVFDPYFEKYRPEHLPSRQRANFLFLTKEEAERFIQDITRNSEFHQKVIVEVRIDPEGVYVLDANFKFKALTILEVAGRLNEWGPDAYDRFITEHSEELEQAIKNYWASALKLSEFLEYYSFNGKSWIRKPGAPQNLPPKYISPEIIYPDRIPPTSIKSDRSGD